MLQEEDTCSICGNLELLFLFLIRTERTFLKELVLLSTRVLHSQSVIYTHSPPPHRGRHHSTKCYRAATGNAVR